jgi:hypothetical protein
MHFASSGRPVAFYSFDVIIAVGCRVNSKRGTQFRIWATPILKEHLVRGFSANEQRLKELRTSLRLVKNVVDRLDITSDESCALLAVVSDYAYALDLLDDFDYRRITVSEVHEEPAHATSCDEALTVVERLKDIEPCINNR